MIKVWKISEVPIELRSALRKLSLPHGVFRGELNKAWKHGKENNNLCAVYFDGNIPIALSIIDRPAYNWYKPRIGVYVKPFYRRVGIGTELAAALKKTFEGETGKILYGQFHSSQGKKMFAKANIRVMAW